jgi:hypothetical protein
MCVLGQRNYSPWLERPLRILGPARALHLHGRNNKVEIEDCGLKVPTADFTS